MSSEVIEKVDVISADVNSGVDSNSSIGVGSKGVSALHDLIAGGVAGSMSVIVGRKFFIIYCFQKYHIAIYICHLYQFSRSTHTYILCYLSHCMCYLSYNMLNYIILTQIQIYYKNRSI